MRHCRPIPTFFIIGAPKCGTTALSAYLSDHPDVLFSDPKEPKYFHTDFDDGHRFARSLEEYERCFRSDRPERFEAVGEGTVWYLYSYDAVPNILDYNPAAKFIVMLRDPVNLFVSLHAQFLWGGYEQIEDPVKAWKAQGARRRDESIPRLCPDPKLLQYGAVARLGSQMERLLERVDEDRVLTVLFDDLANDPGTEYRRALRFLGLTVDDREEFPVVNARRQIVAPTLATMLRLGKLVKEGLGIRRSLGVWKAATSLISSPCARPELPGLFRQELNDYFRDDVALLRNILAADLSNWLEDERPTAGKRS